MDAKQYKDGDFFEITGSVFKNIKESWQAVQLNLMTFLVLIAVPSVLALLMVPIVLLPALTGSDAGAASAVVLAILGVLFIIVVALIIAPAIALTQLDSVVGKKREPKDAFEQGKKFVVQYIILGILSIIAIVIGLILFIVPGLLVMFFLSLAPYILIDKNVDAVTAMKQSYELTKQYWKPVLAVLIVNIAVSAVGYFPFIGWIISLILTVVYFCLTPYVYSVIQGKQVAKVA